MKTSFENDSGKTTSVDIDRSAEIEELNFSDDEPSLSFADFADDQEVISEDENADRELGLTEASLPGHGPTLDDLDPEILIREDGARSPHEPGGDEPMDQHFSIVDGSDIGAGTGLDEAEWAAIDPLDEKLSE